MKRFVMWTWLGVLTAGIGMGGAMLGWPGQTARADLPGNRPRVLTYTLTNMGAFPHVLFLEKSRESIFSFVQVGENTHSSRGVPPEVTLYAIPDYSFAGRKLVKAMRSHNWKEFQARCQDVEPLIRRLKLNLNNYRMGQTLSYGADSGGPLEVVALKTKGRPNGRFDVAPLEVPTGATLLDNPGGFSTTLVDVAPEPTKPAPYGAGGESAGSIFSGPAAALLLCVPIAAAFAISVVLRRRSLNPAAAPGSASGDHTSSGNVV